MQARNERITPYAFLNAVRQGNKSDDSMDVIRQYIAENADNAAAINTRGYDNETALIVASMNKNVDMIRFLLGVKSIDINACADNGATALHLAAFVNNIEVATALLEHGAVITIRTKQGETAADVALQRGHNAIYDLIRNYKHPTPSASSVEPAASSSPVLKPVTLEEYLEAAGSGKLEIVQQYLEENKGNPAAINFRDKMNNSALMYAAVAGNIKVVITLLAAGVEVNTIYTNLDDSALTLAVSYGHTAVVEALLTAHNINVNHCKSLGKTALILAAKRGYIDIVRILLQANGVDLDIHHQGVLAVEYAKENIHVEIESLLLEVMAAKLNGTSKNIIEGTVNFIFDTINDLPPINAIAALDALTSTYISPVAIDKFKREDVWECIQQIRQILTHPCPQNRYQGNPNAYWHAVLKGRQPENQEEMNGCQTGVSNGIVYYYESGFGSKILTEEQGILGLTARNDSTKLPVKRSAVFAYTVQLINQQIIEQKLRLIKWKQASRTIQRWYRGSLCQFARETNREKHLEKLHQNLLLHVVRGEQSEAENIIKKHPELLLRKGAALDYSERTIEGTAFQMTLRTGDEVMAKAIADIYLKANPENGQAVLDAQFDEVFPEGYAAHLAAQQQRADDFERDYLSALVGAITNASREQLQAALNKQSDDSDLCQKLQAFRAAFTALSHNEKVFNPNHLLKVFEKYMEKFIPWYLDKNDPNHWLRLDIFWQQVGWEQRYLSAYYAQVFCTGLYKLVNNEVQCERKLTASNYDTDAIVNFFPLTAASGLGFDGACGGDGIFCCLVRTACAVACVNKKQFKTFIEQNQQAWEAYAARAESAKYARACNLLKSSHKH